MKRILTLIFLVGLPYAAQAMVKPGTPDVNYETYRLQQIVDKLKQSKEASDHLFGKNNSRLKSLFKELENNIEKRKTATGKRAEEIDRKIEELEKKIEEKLNNK